MLANKINLKLAFDSQYSDDVLFGGEMFQIGGAGSVRGHSFIFLDKCGVLLEKFPSR
jgi:hemolysin activation/secretion protein